MTARDLAAAAHGIGSPSTVDGIRALGVTVDQALWSGNAPGTHEAHQAWAAVGTVRRGLAGRGEAAFHEAEAIRSGNRAARWVISSLVRRGTWTSSPRRA